MYKVVVVEDEVMIRKGILMTIDWNAMNCVVVGEASNGEEGFELILRLNPDIVITDVKMPRKDGVEMISELRDAGCRSRFIILTAYSDFQYAQSAVRLGVSDYLLKPFKDGELEETIGRIGTGFQKPEEEKTDFPGYRFYEDRKTKNKYVLEGISYIREHYSEDINIRTVAEYLEISEGYLSRVFRKETDYTFTNYLTYFRMQMATKMLMDCRVKVYEVAEKVGYSDTAYFSSQFKKVMGISPSEYQDRSI